MLIQELLIKAAKEMGVSSAVQVGLVVAPLSISTIAIQQTSVPPSIVIEASKNNLQTCSLSGSCRNSFKEDSGYEIIEEIPPNDQAQPTFSINNSNLPSLSIGSGSIPQHVFEDTYQANQLAHTVPTISQNIQKAVTVFKLSGAVVAAAKAPVTTQNTISSLLSVQKSANPTAALTSSAKTSSPVSSIASTTNNSSNLENSSVNSSLANNLSIDPDLVVANKDFSAQVAGGNNTSAIGSNISTNNSGNSSVNDQISESGNTSIITNTAADGPISSASNSAPSAVDDTDSTPTNSAKIISVLANDTDSDGDTMTVVSTTNPANGSVVINGDGTITYTPNGVYTGVDTFTYTIEDGNQNSVTATVSVTVTNSPPVAVNDATTTIENIAVVIPVLSNDSDPESDTLVAVNETQPANGVVINNGDGTFTYTPNVNFNGIDTFTYDAKDTFNNSNLAIVTVSVSSTYCTTYDQISGSPFTGGTNPYAPLPDGTAGKPYRICNVNQMATLVGDTSLWSKEFILYNNIDISVGAGYPANSMIGTSGVQFTGTFDGNNYTLSNFTHTDNSITNVGLFGYVGVAGTVKNLTVSNINIDGDHRVGGLVGDLRGTVQNVTVSGTINATNGALSDEVGGVVGYMQAATIATATSTVNVTANGKYIGGVIGQAITTSNVSDLYYAGTVTGNGGSSANSNYVGGIAGKVAVTSATGQFTSSGTITGAYQYVGGLFGYLSNTISGASSTANIFGVGYLGGITGYLTGSTISSATYSGNITSTDATAAGVSLGGIAGHAIVSTISNSKTQGTITGAYLENGGIAGELNNIASSITGCYSSMTIISGGSSGGLVGLNGGNITDSYATGDVTSIYSTANGSKIGGAIGSSINGTIENVYATGKVTGSYQNNGGLAGVVSSGTVTNSFATGDVTAQGGYTGGLIGYSYVPLSNVHARGTVTATDTSSIGQSVGGLAGRADGDVSYAYSLGTVYGSYRYVGGLVGYTGINVIISNSFAMANVTSQNGYVGGLVGTQNTNGTITDSYALGNVLGLGTTAEGNNVGGLVGQSLGLINRSFATGNVTGNSSYNGGLVGILTSAGVGSIVDSYASGEVRGLGIVGGIAGQLGSTTSLLRVAYIGGVVTASSAASGFWTGGLVGNNTSSTIEDAYTNAVVTSPHTIKGGLVGQDAGGTYTGNLYWIQDGSTNATLTGIQNIADPGNVLPETPANLQIQGSYVGWDFVTDWTMDATVNYPKPGNLYFCNATNIADTPYANSTATPAGTWADPIRICTADQLNAIGSNPADWNKYFVIEDNIDLTPTAWTGIGSSGSPFGGTLIGKGKIISNFTYNVPGQSDVGLINFLDSATLSGNPGEGIQDAQILAVHLSGVNINGNTDVGALVGEMGIGVVAFSSVQSGTVDGANNTGGLIGKMNKYESRDPAYGQLYQWGSYATNNSSNASVTGTVSNTGGLIGYNAGTIQNSYSTGAVAGQSTVGGFVANTRLNSANDLQGGRITNCYASPTSVTGVSEVGGFVGNNNAAILTNIYSDGANPGLVNTNTGTVVDSFYDNSLATSASAAGTPLTTVQMSQQSSFTNWNFTSIWSTGMNSYNPKFQSE